MESSNPVNHGLRVVVFTNLTPVYQLASDWARRHDHRIVLVVTTPGPTARRLNAYREVIAAAPPEQDFYVTLHPRRLAKILAPLRPDVIVSGSFPHRIPPEVIALPRYGAFNVHPAPLPRYRGPNAARMIYAGEWLDWSWSRSELQRRWTALNLVGSRAKARIGDATYLVERVDQGPGEVLAMLGTLVDRDGDLVAIAVGDGVAWATVRPLAS